MTPELYTLADQLGLTVYGGVNWTWIYGFPSVEATKEFLKHPHVYEHGGILPSEETEGTFRVRIR